MRDYFSLRTIHIFLLDRLLFFIQAGNNVHHWCPQETQFADHLTHPRVSSIEFLLSEVLLNVFRRYLGMKVCEIYRMNPKTLRGFSITDHPHNPNQPLAHHLISLIFFGRGGGRLARIMDSADTPKLWSFRIELDTA